VAWLYAPGSGINYVVAQAEDNDYYLHRLLNGTEAKAGTLFMDYQNHSDFSDWNTMIYGHHMKNGTMFASLVKYQDQEFADFLQNTYGMSEDDFNKQIKELMPDYIKSDLVWEAVAAKEGIKASGEDYDKFVDKMMGTLKFDKKDDLFDVYPETMVKRMYIEQEAKDKLIKQAKVKYVETTSEDTTEQTQSDGSEDTGNTDNTSENAEVKDTIDTTTGK